MKITASFKNLAVLAAFFFALSSAALAQNSGTVTNHALAVGKGPGVAGYTSLPLGSGQIAIGQTSADPTAIAPTGDVTITAAGVTAIGANKVTNAMLRQSGALALIGRSANSTGNVADIQATAGSSCVFMESASTVACGAIATASISANAVTFAKIQQVAASSLVGNPTGSLANSQGITLGATLAFSGSALQTAAHTGDVTTVANSFATTISANVVTNAKMAQGGAASIKGNPTGSTANEQDFTIQGLTDRGAPDATNDKILIFDNAAGTLKYVTPSAVASSAVAGVSSIAGNTGAFTLGGLLSNSTNLLQVVAAAKTDQQTHTSNTLAVTPLHQQDHPSAAKAWGFITYSGATPTLTAGSYNIASVSAIGTGRLTVNFTTAFANVNYACFGNESPATSNPAVATFPSQSVGSLEERFTESGTLSNPISASIVCFGTQ